MIPAPNVQVSKIANEFLFFKIYLSGSDGFGEFYLMFLEEIISIIQSIPENRGGRKKKEQTTDTCSNMDESEKHYAKLRKSSTKGSILYDSIYMAL